ncbi:hypothetical protein [Daejeonella sp. JGW-45]|uniref:hypothetical protein n=1 Tax=Daejeonella sp. JGW-45 TaxID=3034148 RepID=UPI0023EABF60|nr:hypothetical protein [Daejeonella sp. JGW-45]
MKTSVKLTSGQEKLAMRISYSLVHWQRRLAMKMNTTINSLPAQQLKFWLFLVCLLGGGTCIYLIVTSLFFT